MKTNILLLIVGAALGLLCAMIPEQKSAVPVTAPATISESHGLIASYYGDRFHGRCMANGLFFNKNAMVAAHRTLPLGTRIRVRRGQKSVDLTIMDRGPYIQGRHLDLSEGAARRLGMIRQGVSPVVMEILETPRTSKKYHHQNTECLAKDETFT